MVEERKLRSRERLNMESSRSTSFIRLHVFIKPVNFIGRDDLSS